MFIPLTQCTQISVETSRLRTRGEQHGDYAVCSSGSDNFSRTLRCRNLRIPRVLYFVASDVTVLQPCMR